MLMSKMTAVISLDPFTESCLNLRVISFISQSFTKSYLFVEGSPDRKLGNPYNIVLIYGSFK